jgi:HAAS domain-containing protein
MSVSVISDEVRTYLDLVAAKLADLPDAERADLLEDLEGHLREVAAEGEGSLTDRLGPPEAYAEELRVSAGLTPSQESMRIAARINARLARSRIIHAVTTAMETGAAQATFGLLRELRPGWWVLRGHLAVLALSAYAHDSYSTGGALDLLFPSMYGTPVAGAMASVGAIVASVALGRRAATSLGVRRLSWLATIVVLALAMGAPLGWTFADAASFDQEQPAYQLMHQNGSWIANICPYTTDGKLMEEILLFDQEGRPITNVVETEMGYYPGGSSPLQPTPMQPTVTLFPNSYPRPQMVQDPETNALEPFRCPSLSTPTAPASGP